MSDGTWQAVALARDLGKRPLRVRLGDEAVVIFRTQRGLAALTDRCPHRLVPLSAGRVVGETLECSYHGWRFDRDGQCVAIPGHLGEVPRCRVVRWQVTEAEGAIFVARGAPATPPFTHVLAGQPARCRMVKSATRSRLVDVAENILDATHTHFTHKGLLRGLSSRRYRVDVEVRGGPGWVEASYTGEDRQHGLISTLLEGGARLRTVGRYRHPGIAELEYWGPRGLVLATTFHLRQADDETVEGIGWLAGPRGGILGGLKALAFTPLFRIALAQDQKVLTAAFDNVRQNPDARPVIGPLDFLRLEIEAIVAGALPSSATSPRRYEILL